MAIYIGKQTSSYTPAVGLILCLGFVLLGLAFGGMDSPARKQNVAYRVCNTNQATQCDVLPMKHWRKVFAGINLSRGPKFENIHDPRNVRQYPDWFRVEEININDYK